VRTQATGSASSASSISSRGTPSAPAAPSSPTVTGATSPAGTGSSSPPPPPGRHQSVKTVSRRQPRRSKKRPTRGRAAGTSARRRGGPRTASFWEREVTRCPPWPQPSSPGRTPIRETSVAASRLVPVRTAMGSGPARATRQLEGQRSSSFISRRKESTVMGRAPGKWTAQHSLTARTSSGMSSGRQKR
jgi:hypothetical protein